MATAFLQRIRIAPTRARQHDQPHDQCGQPEPQDRPTADGLPKTLAERACQRPVEGGEFEGEAWVGKCLMSNDECLINDE